MEERASKLSSLQISKSQDEVNDGANMINTDAATYGEFIISNNNQSSQCKYHLIFGHLLRHSLSDNDYLCSDFNLILH